MPPNIRYSYSVPNGDKLTYRWDPNGPWSPCSRPCEGKTKAKVGCGSLLCTQQLKLHRISSVIFFADFMRSLRPAGGVRETLLASPETDLGHSLLQHQVPARVSAFHGLLFMLSQACRSACVCNRSIIAMSR